jgi:steroid 5-alpha reductase family enzyme
MEILLLLGISVLINAGMFLIAFKRQTDKLTDISYAISFVAVVMAGLALHPTLPTKVLLASMVAVWAGRLGGYLLVRIRKIGRDKRFDVMRRSFWKFGRFWLSQALSVWMILLAVLLVLGHPEGDFSGWSLLGVAVWAAGLVIEAVADNQKFRFITNSANKGRWIESGLWRYSRHPNYLGEILVWIGIYLVALPNLAGWEVAIGLLSPLFIMTLLLFVSGIPPLEKSADARWGDDPKYQDYKARTSVLLLLPRKRG